MNRRTALLLSLAVLGLFLYLWPALRAPVVLWSDSALDLDWARRGVGIVSPVPQTPGAEQRAHPAKPAYLLFLRAVQAVAPRDKETRFIVVVQSVLLWASIAATSLLVARRRGLGAGASLYLLLLSLLRLRDSASAVMSEAFAAALFLPIAASLLDPPRKPGVSISLGFATAFLFWVRPNVGGAALLLATITLVSSRRWRAVASMLGGFLLLFAPILVLTKSAGDERFRGLGYSFLEASQDYYWVPSSDLSRRRGEPAEIERRETSRAIENWKDALSRKGPDARRQIVWRAFHGLLGTEFYDARWSPGYRRLDDLSRVVTPLLVLGAITILLVAPLRGAGGARAAGLLLVFLITAQNIALGSNPRFVLPFLPVLLVLATASVPSPARGSLLAATLAFGVLIALVATHAFVLDWQWGKIESAGVRIRQRIPKGAFPEREPATLHVRVAPPLLPSAAHLSVLGPGATLLYRSDTDGERRSPAITLPLPQSLLDENARGPVDLELVFSGSYGRFHYLLFPVIPPPWRSPAIREGSADLSPSTGIRSGSLDWWAHRGVP